MARPKLELSTIDELYEYKSETVWRLTEDDIRTAVADRYPGVPQSALDEIVERAYLSFTIHDWTEHVLAFADTVLEDE